MRRISFFVAITSNPQPVHWAARGHKGSTHLSPVHALSFYRALGSALPQLVDFHRTLLNHALALSAVKVKLYFSSVFVHSMIQQSISIPYQLSNISTVLFFCECFRLYTQFLPQHDTTKYLHTISIVQHIYCITFLRVLPSILRSIYILEGCIDRFCDLA